MGGTEVFLQELKDFLGKLRSVDASEIEWEKGEFGFKVALFPERPLKEESQPALSSNGKNEPAGEVLRIVSPVVGIFHFLEEEIRPGLAVQAREALGFVNSVTVDHKIEASAGGKVSEIHVIEGQPVEYGQVLFSLEVPHVS